ncbi:MAG: BON domain-containing protein [Burkholderiaceae bacterium]|nr:BON domain-containing protein [Burkholderiaceae bacterium]
MRSSVLDNCLCVAGFLSVAATVAVYAGPTPDLQSIEVKIAQNPGAIVDDIMIASEVQAALRADPQTAILRISVDTRNGVVSLSGSVPSVEIEDHVVQVVASIRDVRDIKNSLRVIPAG